MKMMRHRALDSVIRVCGEISPVRPTLKIPAFENVQKEKDATIYREVQKKKT